ncbi:hypothetical protein ANO11243_003560 [Dothideomycetidae sp. 11243]|nr:hypothetical protein ANO11243_003560 [fungal sp. No.11243]
MWPYKFILNLLGPMVESGKINLQTQTPITSITNDGHKQNPACKYSVHTSRGTILAKQIICASNAYVAGLLPEYEKNIIPCKGICCHIATPEGKGPHSAPLLTNSYIHHTPDGDLSYLIPRTDGSIIVGGASKSFFPYKEQWYKNVDDSRLIDAAKDYYEGYMQRTFHGWEDSGADVTKIWTGVMGYSFDSHPHIGRVPDKEGQYIAAGFNGHGMPVIWLATKGLVAMVVSDMRRTSGAADVPRKEFKDIGLPRLYETTKERIRRAQTAKEEDGDIIGIGAAFAKDATLEINSTEEP